MTQEITWTQLAMKIRTEVKLMVKNHRNQQFFPAITLTKLIAELKRKPGINQSWCNRIEQLTANVNEIYKEMEEWLDE